MHRTSSALTLALVSTLSFLAALTGCSGDHPDAAHLGASSGTPDVCASPNEGCACANEGVRIACGSLKQRIGDYVQCSMGEQTCIGGRWGACVGDELVTKEVPLESSSLRPSALAPSPTACGHINPCDPYCHVYDDTPDPAFIAGDDALALVDGGLSLAEKSLGMTCTSITIAPANPTVTITGLAPLVTNPAALAFTTTFEPAGCVPAGTRPTWTVSRADLATIDSNGILSLFGAVAGNGIMTVQAFFGSLSSNVVSVNVHLRVTKDEDVAPNYVALPAQIGTFWTDPERVTAAAPTLSQNLTWLYPYADTIFPLGLPAPVLQYKVAADEGNSVKVALRIPSGASSSTAIFEYALVVREATCSDANQCYSNATAVAPNPKLRDPQIVIPPAAWRAFERSASGSDADLVLQRRVPVGLQGENVRRIRFANGQLKGTVYYGTYTSPLVGNTGAVMKIVPGATAPEVGVRNGNRCLTCHIVNQDGTTAYANGYRSDGSGGFNDSQLFDISVPPSPMTVVLRSFNNAGGTPNPGLRFNYAATRPDGRLYLTHGGGSGGDSNWRAPNVASSFWDPTTATPTARSVTSWPANAQAVTPRFSVAGDKIAFSYWAGNALPSSPNGTISANSNGNTLVVVDFACAAGAGCPGGAISNARNVTPGGGTNANVWPSFTPDGLAVIYQKQIVNSNKYLGWSPSKINTVAGAQAEIWMTDIRPNASSSSTPTRLNALNGLTAAGVNYLPQTPRDIAPQPFATNYHVDGATFTIRQADNCNTTANMTDGVSDTRLNYRPSVLPVDAGGMHWVVFGSRRMYGSIATADPWDPEPTQTCGSKTPKPKKLWVAAVDDNWTPGTDPSHPAFYLPGQELVAGNTEAYWVNSPCVPLDGACETSADCCQSPQAASCRIDLPISGDVTRSCRSASACQPTGGSCSSDSDCCGTQRCLGNPGVCAPLASYEPASVTRDFVGQCPMGTRVVWQPFQWQSTTPEGSSISFYAQTGSDAGSLGPEVLIGRAPPSGGAGVWVSSPTSVDEALRGATPSQQSRVLLRVRFSLETEGAATPTLHAWRQLFSCIPSE